MENIKDEKFLIKNFAVQAFGMEKMPFMLKFVMTVKLKKLNE